MPDPSGQQADRRSSTTACSPTAPHACQASLRSGESSPVATRKSRPQPLTTDAESHERDMDDSASDSEPTAHQPRPTPVERSATLADRTDEEIVYDIYAILMENAGPNSADVSHFYETAPKLPPITMESLAELDMTRIINNPKLRHDVNFDRELHFRPNLDGSKGRQKVRAAEQYWLALEGEFFMYRWAAVHKRAAQTKEDEAHAERILKLSQKRLRAVFEAVRDILKTLVPDPEQHRVTAKLDVDLIMQEITSGVCDLIDLSNWISKVMKKHCAPMRDQLIDAMVREIHEGALQDQPGRLVMGLRQLLGILEYMKLDVANHQIRHMRPCLINQGVAFEKQYNVIRIAAGKIDVLKCQRWFNDELEHLRSRAQETGDLAPTHLDALVSATLRDALFNETTPYPQSYYLDSERLRSVRNDIRSTVSHELCRELLADLVSANVTPADLLKAQGALQCSVSAIVGMSGRFLERVDNIAVEIVRFLLILEGRYPPFDSTLLGMVETRLANMLQPNSPAFDKLARDTCDRLLPKLKTSVAEHARLSALDLQSTLIPPPPTTTPPQAFGFGAVCAPPPQHLEQYDPDEDFVRRLTHVICLHWQVWADLIYLAPIQDHAASSSPSLSPPSEPALSQPGSVAVSPMMPLAQAVYAPGKKFLPVDVTVAQAIGPVQQQQQQEHQAGQESGDSTTQEQEQESLDATQQQQQQQQQHPA